MIRGVFQRDESRARADLVANAEKEGIQPAVLALIEQAFDSFGRIIIATVQDVASAETVAQDLAKRIEPALNE